MVIDVADRASDGLAELAAERIPLNPTELRPGGRSDDSSDRLAGFLSCMRVSAAGLRRAIDIRTDVCFRLHVLWHENLLAVSQPANRVAPDATPHLIPKLGRMSGYLGVRTGSASRGACGRMTALKAAKELVGFARTHGYRVDELVEIIENVG